MPSLKFQFFNHIRHIGFHRFGVFRIAFCIPDFGFAPHPHDQSGLFDLGIGTQVGRSSRMRPCLSGSTSQAPRK